jgi:hypothetical protein
MPTKVAKNQERAVEDAYRVARLRREERAKDGTPRRPGEHAGDRVQVARSREGIAG